MPNIEPTSNPENPILKSLQLAALYTGIAVIGFILLTLVALYVPNNFLLRKTDSSRVKTWLPGNDAFSPGFVLVNEYKTTNEDVAEDRPDSDQVLQMLNNWGRLDSYSKLYLFQDRCTVSAPRAIRVSIILHRDDSGAQAYLEWLQQEEQSQSYAIDTLDVGDGGYLFWRVTGSMCSDDESEQRLEVKFGRNNAIGVVMSEMIEGQYSKDDLLELVLALARTLNERILAETSQ